MLNLVLKSRSIKLAMLVLGLSITGTVMAQSARHQQIAERLAPVGSVCLAGEDCAAGTAAPTAAAPTAVAPVAGGVELFNASAGYNQYCAMCHDTGMAGAPTRVATDHWVARLADVGFNTIVTNAITGINAMPARGMCMTCSDDDIAELVSYLMGDAAP